MPDILGIHHVTAIAGDPQRNLDFYAGVLGLRLVKLTVNYDDPTTYHLYYGDGQGHPGTIMTFFAWPGAMAGRIGTGQLTLTSFAVPENSLRYWKSRLADHGTLGQEARSEFDEELLFFTDPDGLQLELISTRQANPENMWNRGPVPLDLAICGFHHVTLSENGYERTAALLTEILGFKRIEEHRTRFRYAAGTGLPGTMVDLVCAPEGRPGRVAVGTVHHVAWRTPTDEQQVQWLETVNDLQYNVTPIIDRTYFHSIYFHEPGGVLFEIATDPPGFAVDEPANDLGSSLVLPRWLENERSRLERILPPLSPPKLAGGQVDAAD
ncbi:MAG TPA: ring-cleaving dioxygenase [Terriglobales bacterium]|nr:ring-cleaving dioxygenase [Terriglobales bacterium]